jgi:hypothetical protein
MGHLYLILWLRMGGAIPAGFMSSSQNFLSCLQTVNCWCNAYDTFHICDFSVHGVADMLCKHVPRCPLVYGTDILQCDLFMLTFCVIYTVLHT